MPYWSTGAVRSCIILAVQADRHSVPLRCHGPERVLLGTRADPATLAHAEQVSLDILDPPGDLHAPAGYRKHVADVLLRRAVGKAFQRAAAAGEGEPWAGF
jgi:CO/xanthine dehydrogenase FAD-binding subunit